MATLKEFISSITKHSIARSNRFQVIIPLPAKLLDTTVDTQDRNVSAFFDSTVVKLIRGYFGPGNIKAVRGLELMIEQTELPGKNLNTADVRYNGDVIKHANGIIYAAQQMTFIVSRDMYEKNILDEWMNLIINPTTHEIEYMDDYVSNITINQLDEQDNIVHSIVLIDAYPMNTNPLVVSNSETNMGHRLMTMFAYRKWERVKANESTNRFGISKLSQTPLGQVLTPILSNPAVQKTLEVFQRETGIDLEGEAVAIYNQLDSIVTNTTGSSINKSATLIENIRGSVMINNKITTGQKARLLEIIDDALTALRS